MIPFIKDEEGLDRELSDAKDKVVVVCLTSKSDALISNTSIDEQSNEFKELLFYKIDVEDADSN